EHRQNLLRIENVKQHYVIPVKPQRRNGVYDGFRFLKKIRDHNRDATPVPIALKVFERFSKICQRAWLGLLESREEPRKLSRPRGRFDVFPYLIVKNHQTRRIALTVDGEIK